jgi:hypothetical protein
LEKYQGRLDLDSSAQDRLVGSEIAALSLLSLVNPILGLGRLGERTKSVVVETAITPDK